MRFFAAVHNGIVVGTRKTTREYRYAVIHVGGAAGPFATFHLTAAAADVARRYFRDSAPTKVIVPTIETSRDLGLGSNLRVGAVLQP